MPSDAKQIVAFDGKALRAHPLFASMLKTLRASPAGNDLGKLEKACGFNPIDVIDSAAAAGDFDHMNIVVAFRGTKSPQEILGCMAKVDGKEPTTLRGLAAVPLGGPGVAVAAGDVVLIGDRPAVEAALNGGSGKSALSSMVKLDAGVVAAAAGELPEGPVSKFAGVFKASDKDLAVEVTLDTPTPQRAEGLVSIVKKGIAEGPKKGDIASDKKLARDVAELLRSVTVKADGSKVVGRVGVSGDAKKQAAYVALVTRIVETALAKKNGGSTPPAAPPPPPAPKKK